MVRPRRLELALQPDPLVLLGPVPIDFCHLPADPVEQPVVPSHQEEGVLVRNDRRVADAIAVRDWKPVGCNLKDVSELIDTNNEVLPSLHVSVSTV